MNVCRVVVFALGNSLMGDDGVAIEVLKILDGRGVGENIRLVNAGCDPLRIAELAPDFDETIIIDAANMGLEPGKLHTFSADDAEFPYNKTNISGHGIGLPYVIKILRLMGIIERIRLVGIQPFLINPKPELSVEMRKRVDNITNIVWDMLKCTNGDLLKT